MSLFLLNKYQTYLNIKIKIIKIKLIFFIFRFLKHVNNLLKIPGSSIAFGGDLIPSKEHSIPSCYGSWNPTAIKIPIKEMLKKENFSLCVTEIFGGFQIIVDYNNDELPLVLEALERVDAHLTAAVVSNDVVFQNQVLAHTVNGTTYCGIRARTTGTYTHAYTHKHTHANTDTHTHILNIHTYTNTHTYAHSFMRTHTHTHIQTTIYIYLHTHTYTDIQTLMYLTNITYSHIERNKLLLYN